MPNTQQPRYLSPHRPPHPCSCLDLTCRKPPAGLGQDSDAEPAAEHGRGAAEVQVDGADLVVRREGGGLRQPLEGVHPVLRSIRHTHGEREGNARAALAGVPRFPEATFDSFLLIFCGVVEDGLRWAEQIGGGV